MNKSILNALMRLFAIVGKADGDSAGSEARTVVENYLRQHLNSRQAEEYIKVYDDILAKEESKAGADKLNKRRSLSAVKVVVICNQINEELDQRQRLIVLIKLVEFITANDVITPMEREFIEAVYGTFNIPETEFNSLVQFATGSFAEMSNNHDLLLISNNNSIAEKHIYSEGFGSDVGILQFPSEGLLLARCEKKDEIYINGQLPDSRMMILPQGSTLRGAKADPVYYSDIIGCFMSEKQTNRVSYEVKDVSYTFKSGDIGVQTINIQENSGKLIGIMGGSGAGKSTLLNVLNGNSKPTSGKVLVNGMDIYDRKAKPEGIIGFVSQDDLLVEELSVYQNLYFNTKLCFGNLNEAEINALVMKILNQLGLSEIKDLQVGDVFNKVISGGQRKRLNIALELIREPMILFADEPTSGLSSRDSENVIDLLKELALKGKLVFVVIHQPSSDIFKLFDKLMVLDKGGYLAYYGNPLEAVTYFKRNANHIKADESECHICGNVNPEQIFTVLESKVLDEFGSPTKERKVTPKEWNDKFQANNSTKDRAVFSTVNEPIKPPYQKPSFIQQFLIYFKRDVLAKLANKQYLIISFAEPLVLGVLLALILRKSTDTGYIFSENNNLPSYLFICVIVSLFLGLMLSAEEIFKDRKILKREAFLSLNRDSYLLAKMLVLFIISSVQTIVFVLIGNTILGIHGMTADYWLILFSTSFFANMLGLNISSGFNSAVAIYIMIPLLIIPQILLSGVLVKYHDLYKPLSGKAVVPFVGDIMASRWAFEALAVNQYKYNEHERKFYSLDKKIKQANYYGIAWSNAMHNLLDEWKSNPAAKADKKEVLEKELALFAQTAPTTIAKQIAALSFDNPDKVASEINVILTEIRQFNMDSYKLLNAKKDSYMDAVMANITKKEEYENRRMANANNSLNDFISSLAPNEDNLLIENGHLVKLSDPVYTDGPVYTNIRAHYFAPSKTIFGKSVDTFWVNVLVLWAMSFVLWFGLKFNVIRKIVGGV